MSLLASRKCVPCSGGVPPLTSSEVRRLLAELDGWEARDHRRIFREFRFPDFQSALEFTVQVGDIAEAEQHHPDIHLAWGKAGIESWTHKINALTESDFILATKIERAYAERANAVAR